MIFKKTTLAVFIISLIALVGCSSNKKKSSEPVATKTDYALELNGDSDSGLAGLLRTVNFDFDSSYLREGAKATLDENIKYLLEHHELEIQVEGHCDERGSAQYNLPLESEEQGPFLII